MLYGLTQLQCEKVDIKEGFISNSRAISITIESVLGFFVLIEMHFLYVIDKNINFTIFSEKKVKILTSHLHLTSTQRDLLGKH